MIPEQDIQRWFDGELSEAEARRVKAAIDADPDARAFAGALAETRALLREADAAAPVPEAPPGALDAILRRVAAEPAPGLIERLRLWWEDANRAAVLATAGAAAAALVALGIALRAPPPGDGAVARSPASPRATAPRAPEPPPAPETPLRKAAVAAAPSEIEGWEVQDAVATPVETREGVALWISPQEESP